MSSPGDRRRRILGRLARDRPSESPTTQLCQAFAEVTETSGAAIMLMSADLPLGSVCTTDAVSAAIEQLQYALGEGPCVDAFRGDWPVLEADLGHPAVTRWPAFNSRAVAEGVGAVFAFPLQVGAVRLGALVLYRDRPGPLTDTQHADALVMADIAARAVLGLPAQAPRGHLAAELEAGGDFHYRVHQASGMVAAQLGVNVAHALIRLRGYAFGNDRPLAEVADDVVARRLRFDVRRGEDGAVR